MSSRFGLTGVCLVLAVLVIAVIQISPVEDSAVGANRERNALPIPPLNTTEALAAWHGNPISSVPEKNDAPREQLTQSWNAFCGKFSPLPKFDELPATFRLRSLAAGYGENSEFTIALCSDWNAETITDKLRPFRRQLSALAAHRVDIDRLDNGVLVETHELTPLSNIYVLRHACWLIVTNSEVNIPVLAQAAVEQQDTQKEEITEATYAVLNEILLSYGISGNQERENE